MKKILKIISIIIICLIIIFLCVYFLITSSFFLKKAILPIIGSSIGAEISTKTIVFSPFVSEIEFTELLIDSKGNYSVKIGSFYTKFKLFDLFRNRIIVDKFILKDSYIKIIQKEVTDNIITSSDNDEQQPASKENRTVNNQSTPLYLDLNKILIDNFNLCYAITRSDLDKSSLTEFNGFHLSIPKITSGKPGNAEFKCKFNIFDGKNEDKISGSFSGDIDTILGNNSFPTNLDLVSQLKVQKNITPIIFHFESSTGKNNQPFKLQGKFTQLPLLPLFKTFVEGSYSKTDGMVDSFEIKINGSDLSNFDISSNINGTIKSNISNLTLPIELEQYDIVKLLFLPIEILANITRYTTENIFSQNMSIITDSAQQITRGIKDMNFKTGIINIWLNRGVLDIKQLDFEGGQLNAVRSLTINGKVDLNDKINIETSTSLAGIAIPIKIEGTINNPTPNFLNTLPGMIIGTTSNILTTGFELGKTLGKSLLSDDDKELKKKE